MISVSGFCWSFSSVWEDDDVTRSDCCDNSGVMPSAGYDGCFRLSAWKVDFHVNMLRSRQDGGQDWTGPADWHSRETESGSTFTRQLTERSDSALSSSQTLDQFQRVLLTCTDTKFAMCCKICFFINICPNFPLGPTTQEDTLLISESHPSYLRNEAPDQSSLIFFQVKEMFVMNLLVTFCGSSRELLRDHVHFSGPLPPLNWAEVGLWLSFLSWVAGPHMNISVDKIMTHEVSSWVGCQVSLSGCISPVCVCSVIIL